jgi:hypothetical protein
MIQAAVQWAVIHPADSITDAAVLVGYGEQALPLAGDGAPLVAEFCVAELAAALGLSTDAGRRYLGHALELRYRLPGVWERVVTGDLPVWKARRIAEATLSLAWEGARFVDRHVASTAHRIGPAALERLVGEALIRFDPKGAAERDAAAGETRGVDVRLRDLTTTSTVDVIACLDLADALDLEAALQVGAEALRTAGSEESLDVRRSIALGDLARGRRPLDLSGRELVVHVHADGDVATVESPRAVVTVDHVRDWCAAAGTVTVTPVIDLNRHQESPGRRVPDRIAQQVRLRDATCVFPWCTRPARGCDLDHVVPRGRNGPTSTSNLAPLCRSHHRLKTHGGWTYAVVGPAAYLWTSPHGHHYRRDRRGTGEP